LAKIAGLVAEAHFGRRRPGRPVSVQTESFLLVLKVHADAIAAMAAQLDPDSTLTDRFLLSQLKEIFPDEYPMSLESLRK
jgi:hypothetical protein